MKKQKWHHLVSIKVPIPGKWYCNDILFYDDNAGFLENTRIELLFFLKKRLICLYQRRKRIDLEKVKFKFTDLGKGSFSIDWREPIPGGGKNAEKIHS